MHMLIEIRKMRWVVYSFDIILIHSSRLVVRFLNENDLIAENKFCRSSMFTGYAFPVIVPEISIYEYMNPRSIMRRHFSFAMLRKVTNVIRY